MQFDFWPSNCEGKKVGRATILRPDRGHSLEVA
jgi:hypothetical protein